MNNARRDEARAVRSPDPGSRAPDPETDVAVVGAGVAGMTAAAQLARAGLSVVVLEREDRVGGLARTFEHDGFTFDVGPHRFFSHERAITRYIRAVLGATARDIERESAVYLHGRRFPWPLRLLPLLRLGPRTLASAGLDLVHRPTFDGLTFESLALSRYGRTLYDLFIKTCTQKFTTTSCADLHCSWLTESVDRAIIDRRDRFSSLLGVLKVMLKPRVRTKFIYPRGGCGVYAERLRREIESRGGTVLTGAGDVEVDAEGSRVRAVTAGGRRWPVRALVWTAPVTRLAALLGRPEAGLGFTDTILYNVRTRRRLSLRDQWVYFGERKYLFVRISFPRLFHGGNVPPGRDAACVEVVNINPAWWDRPERLIPTIVRHLAEVRICRPRDVEAVHIERARESYPMYRLDYPERKRALLADLAGFGNLVLLGRCGRFEYNNMDESIRDALLVAADLARRLGNR